jgi:signal transduction histidine kinase
VPLEEIAALVRRFGVKDLRTRGVLLVDDEPLNTRVLRGFLEDEWTVHEAPSAKEALEIAAAAPLDVVVADQRMPGMSGVELLEELRRRRPDVAGVVLTGYADLQALESAINRASVFRFLRKPVDAAEVVHVVERASASVAQQRTIAALVKLLARRSDELSESLERLASQQRMLLDLERLATMGQVAAGVTHDLRNVMVALRLAEWEIAEASVAPALRDTMTAGVAGVDNLLKTLQTLHDYARTGSLTLQLATVNPSSVVDDALAIARMDLKHRTRKVQCVVAPDLPPLHADRQKLTQVIVNLVRNALQASEAPSPVRVAASLAASRDVVFAVEDEGPGIPAELRERLFEPFASTKAEAGLGMGLYMARMIVESHRGRISVSEGAGRGARFEVAVPAADAVPSP